jgi:hypothetical protein
MMTTTTKQRDKSNTVSLVWIKKSDTFLFLCVCV